MNQTPISVIGNLTDDPKTSDVGGSTKVYFSVAAEHRFQKNGEWQGEPSFIPVVAWRDLADQAAQVLSKGIRVIVTGRLDQRSYEKDGERKQVFEVVADDIAVSVRGVDGVTRRPPRSQGDYSGSSSGFSQQAPDEAPW